MQNKSRQFARDALNFVQTLNVVILLVVVKAPLTSLLYHIVVNALLATHSALLISLMIVQLGATLLALRAISRSKTLTGIGYGINVSTRFINDVSGSGTFTNKDGLANGATSPVQTYDNVDGTRQNPNETMPPFSPGNHHHLKVVEPRRGLRLNLSPIVELSSSHYMNQSGTYNVASSHHNLASNKVISTNTSTR